MSERQAPQPFRDEEHRRLHWRCANGFECEALAEWYEKAGDPVAARIARAGLATSARAYFDGQGGEEWRSWAEQGWIIC